MRRLLYVTLAIAFAALHSAATLALGVWLFGRGMDRFEAGVGGPSLAERVGEAVFVTHHPTFFAARWLPGRLTAAVQVALFALDGVIWGSAGAWLVGRLTNAIGRRS